MVSVDGRWHELGSRLGRTKSLFSIVAYRLVSVSQRFRDALRKPTVRDAKIAPASLTCCSEAGQCLALVRAPALRRNRDSRQSPTVAQCAPALGGQARTWQRADTSLSHARLLLRIASLSSLVVRRFVDGAHVQHESHSMSSATGLRRKLTVRALDGPSR